ncbi:MAG: hypothetical protein ABUK01_09300 [Leptospirales bacterium]
MQIGSTTNVAMQSAHEMGNLLKDMTAKTENFQDKMLDTVVHHKVQTQEARAKAQMLDVFA